MPAPQHSEIKSEPKCHREVDEIRLQLSCTALRSRKSSVPVECTQWQTDRQTRLCHTTIFTPVRKTFNTSVDLFPPLIRPTTRVFSGCQISCQFGAFQSISAALFFVLLCATHHHAACKVALHSSVFLAYFALARSAINSRANPWCTHGCTRFFSDSFSSAKIKTCNWANRRYFMIGNEQVFAN